MSIRKAFRLLIVIAALPLLSIGSRKANPKAYVKSAQKLFEDDDLEGAEREYRKALELDPEYTEARDGLVWVLYEGTVKLYKSEEFEKAEKKCREMIALSPNDPALHYNLGQVLIKKKDFKGAKEAYRKAIELDSTYVAAYYNLGAVLYKEGDLTGAEKAYNNAIDLDPTYVDAYYNLGAVLYREDDLAGAKKMYNNAIDLDPTCVEAYNNLGVVLEDEGDLAGAEKAYRKALALDPNYAIARENLFWLLHKRGVLLAEKGDFDGAEMVYRQAMELEVNSAIAHNSLGVLLSRKGDYEGAEREYRIAIKLDSTYALAYENLGNRLRDKGDREGAVLAYRKAVALGRKGAKNQLEQLRGVVVVERPQIPLIDSTAVAHNNRGVELYGEGNFWGAAMAFLKAIRHDPKFASPHAGLGMSWYRIGNRVGAEREYRKAIELDGDSTEVSVWTHNALGVLFFDKRDFKKAKSEYRIALALDPASGFAHLSLAELLLAEDNPQEAERELSKAIELTPPKAGNYRLLGRLLFKRKKFAEAKDAFREAIELEPTDVLTYNDLAYILLADTTNLEDNLKEAKSVLDKAMELDPHNSLTHGYLGLLHLKKRDFKEAEREYREAVRIDSSDVYSLTGLGMSLQGIEEFKGAEAAFLQAFRMAEKQDLDSATLERVTMNYVIILAESGYGRCGIADFEGAIQKGKDALKGLKKYQKHGLLSEGVEEDLRIHTYSLLGITYLRNQDSKQAIKYFRKTLDLEPKDASTLYNLALAYFSLRRFNEAEVLASTLRSMQDDSPKADTLAEKADSLLVHIEKHRNPSERPFRVRWWQFLPLALCLAFASWALILSYRKFPELFKKLMLIVFPVFFIVAIVVLIYPLITKLEVPGVGKIEINMSKIASQPTIKFKLSHIEEPPRDESEESHAARLHPDLLPSETPTPTATTTLLASGVGGSGRDEHTERTGPPISALAVVTGDLSPRKVTK